MTNATEGRPYVIEVDREVFADSLELYWFLRRVASRLQLTLTHPMETDTDAIRGHLDAVLTEFGLDRLEDGSQ